MPPGRCVPPHVRSTGSWGPRDDDGAVARRGALRDVSRRPVAARSRSAGAQRVRARALEELPGLSGRFEIYHATAPLIRATAPPLGAATLQRLRREGAVRWTGEAALAPLLDRDGWDVVGAVAARADAGTWPVSTWSLGALLLL